MRNNVESYTIAGGKKRYKVKFQVKDAQGKPVQVKKEGFLKSQEAKDWMHEYKNMYTKDGTKKFKYLYKSYLEYSAVRVKESTLSTKTSIAEAHIVPYFGEMRIKDITKTNVKDWQNYVIAKKFSDTYLRTIHRQLSAIMNYAVDFYDLKENVVKKVKAMGEKHAEEMKYFTLDEFNEFRGSTIDNLLHTTMFNTLFYTGMRVGEVLALTPNDIDFRKGLIDVSKTYTRLKKKDIISKPKTKSSIRVVPIPAFLLEVLREYMGSLPNLKRRDRIFPYTRGQVGKWKDNIVEDSGVKRIRIHDFRHSHVALLIELGYAPSLIAKRIGHADPRTTLRVYSHLYPHKQEVLVNHLDKIHGTNIVQPYTKRTELFENGENMENPYYV